MKRLTIPLGIIIILLLWSVCNSNSGPYSGTYGYVQDPNIVLKINDDLTCIMYYTIDKNSEFMEGHYSVDNDNNITLVLKKDNISKSLTGKVKGSTIEMASMNGMFIKK